MKEENKEETRGVLYIAFGELFLKEMQFSIESLKKHNPDIPITVFSDRPFVNPLVDNIQLMQVQHMRPKIDFIIHAPYDRTLFLDTDTIINHDISDMFDILDKFDICAAHDLARKRKKFKDSIPPYGKIPYAFSEVNTGVMSFRMNDRVKNLFKAWKQNFYKFYNVVPWDQPSFRVSLWESDASVYIFPVEYNVRSKANREKQRRFHHEFGEEHLKTRIYHMHADPRINQGKYEVSSLKEAKEYCEQNFMEY